MGIMYHPPRLAASFRGNGAIEEKGFVALGGIRALEAPECIPAYDHGMLQTLPHVFRMR